MTDSTPFSVMCIDDNILLVDALERLGAIDLAGFKVKFAPGNHNGSSLVDLTVIGAQGLYRR